MPDPVPVMILGRLAVDKAFQGQGIGAGLLKDAVLRTMQAAGIAGIRALLMAHAISDAARRFYEGYGFAASPIDPIAMMIPLTGAARSWGRRTVPAFEQLLNLLKQSVLPITTLRARDRRGAQ
jgi:hypothetical protein